MKTYVITHGFYGCETGCCGYRLFEEHEPHLWHYNGWTFDHPDDTSSEGLIEFARKTFKEVIDTHDLVVVGEYRKCGEC